MTTDKTNYRETLLTFLAKKKQDGLLGLLRTVSQEERVRQLRIMLEGAAKRHNDEQAALLLEAVLYGVDDLMAIDHTDEAGHYLPGQMRNAHRDRSMTARSVMNISLWTALPAGGDGTYREFIAQDESREVPCKVPTLPITKSMAISVAADYWRWAPKNGVADEALAWILDVYATMQFREERTMVADILRKSSDAGTSHVRLLRAYRQVLSHQTLGKFRCGGDDIAKIFAIAWMRSVCVTKTGSDILAAAEALSNASSPAYDHLVKMAERTREQDFLVRRFINETFLGQRNEYGEPHFKYLDDGLPEITVRLPRGSAWESLEDRRNQAHDEFGKIRDRVQAWLKLNLPELNVRLVVTIPGTAKDDEPLFERTQYI